MTEGRFSSRFRPGFWATLCSLAVFVVLVGLGTWQVQRLAWKRDLIAAREAGLAAPPIALPRGIADPETLDYRRAALAGVFLHDRELRLVNRTRKGEVGIHVITPLVLHDGRVILVDRGWVPMDRRDAATRVEGQVAGLVALEAVLRRAAAGRRSVFQPENEPATNTWFRVDPTAMAAAVKLPNVIGGLYAEALAPDPPGGLPRAGAAWVEIRNDHLNYAITWYALAAVLLAVYIAFGLKRGRD